MGGWSWMELGLAVGWAGERPQRAGAPATLVEEGACVRDWPRKSPPGPPRPWASWEISATKWQLFDFHWQSFILAGEARAPQRGAGGSSFPGGWGRFLQSLPGEQVSRPRDGEGSGLVLSPQSSPAPSAAAMQFLLEPSTHSGPSWLPCQTQALCFFFLICLLQPGPQVPSPGPCRDAACQLGTGAGAGWP